MTLKELKEEIAVLEQQLRTDWDYSQEDIDSLEVGGAMANDEGGICGETTSVDFEGGCVYISSYNKNLEF